MEQDYTLAEARKLAQHYKDIVGEDYTKHIGMVPGEALNDQCNQMLEKIDEVEGYNLSKVGYGQSFLLFLFVDFKLANQIETALKNYGFRVQIKENEGNDDREILVTVNASSAHIAHEIISTIIQ